jgi:hypothetical protein
MMSESFVSFIKRAEQVVLTNYFFAMSLSMKNIGGRLFAKIGEGFVQISHCIILHNVH